MKFQLKRSGRYCCARPCLLIYRQPWKFSSKAQQMVVGASASLPLQFCLICFQCCRWLLKIPVALQFATPKTGQFLVKCAPVSCPACSLVVSIPVASSETLPFPCGNQLSPIHPVSFSKFFLSSLMTVWPVLNYLMTSLTTTRNTGRQVALNTKKKVTLNSGRVAPSLKITSLPVQMLDAIAMKWHLLPFRTF